MSMDRYFNSRAKAALHAANVTERNNRHLQQMADMTHGNTVRMKFDDVQYWLLGAPVMWGGWLWNIQHKPLGCGVYEMWAIKDNGKVGGE